MEKTYDLNVAKEYPLISPKLIRKTLPISKKEAETVVKSRKNIIDILFKDDPRLLVVLGPCSIVSAEHALRVGRFIRDLQKKVKDTIFLAARLYFEKPRTDIGWKGLINDPGINKRHNINRGLYLARLATHSANEMGVPCTTEILTQIAAERLGGVLSACYVGARSAEDQDHRDWASAMSPVVGFKNGTDGDIKKAVCAVYAAGKPQTFTGHNKFGQSTIKRSKGNPYCHIILRGGRRPNYDAESIREVRSALREKGLPEVIMVDCSHGNSRKNPKNQEKVFFNVLEQRLGGFRRLDPDRSIRAVMLEANEKEGRNDDFIYGRSRFKDIDPGISITDPCLSFAKAEEMIISAHKELVRCAVKAA